MRKIISRGVIIEKDYFYAIFGRKVDEFGNEKEYYVIPGGGIEEDESLEENIIRELKEELSVDVKIIGYLGSDQNKNTISHFFRCEIINGKPILTGEESKKNNKNNYYEIVKLNFNEIDKIDINSKNLIKNAFQEKYVKNEKIYIESIKKPIIGIVGRPDLTTDDDNVLIVEEHYRKAIVKKGGIPFLILPPQDLIYYTTKPNEANRLTDEEKNDLERIIDMCDGIVMQGGYKWYEYDEFICKYAIEKDIPLLAMCMSMQLLGKIDSLMNNKSEYHNVPNNNNVNHFQKGVKYAHKINIEDNTLLKKIIAKDQIEVNSRHKNHIPSVNTFKVSAYSEDGQIEALELSNKRFILGVQWHPEKMLDYDDNMNKIFAEFINETKK
ncbi:MAG TPA: C26 family cysteine hydrolase domain-containing family [Tenericutes bacterium]|nr:C26 family cysteine hydrolase domain-containing family [Mycoplasmatota bacterium]